MLSLLRPILAEVPLQFVLIGLFDKPSLKSITSLLEIPTIGVVTKSDTNQSDAYLVARLACSPDFGPPQMRVSASCGGVAPSARFSGPRELDIFRFLLALWRGPLPASAGHPLPPASAGG